MGIVSKQLPDGTETYFVGNKEFRTWELAEKYCDRLLNTDPDTGRRVKNHAQSDRALAKKKAKNRKKRRMK